MTGEDILFAIVVWTLGSVPLTLLMAGAIGFGAENDAPAPEVRRQECTDQAA